MQLARAEVEEGAAVYAVVRPDWESIGLAIAGRLAVAVLVSFVGALAICYGWLS